MSRSRESDGVFCLATRTTKAIEVPMPRYFFHLKADTGNVVDDEGLFLHDINRARSGILQIVDEILSERGFEQADICGQRLEIADETGETVLRIDL